MFRVVRKCQEMVRNGIEGRQVHLTAVCHQLKAYSNYDEGQIVWMMMIDCQVPRYDDSEPS